MSSMKKHDAKHLGSLLQRWIMHGVRPLRLPLGCAYMLRRQLKRVMLCDACGDELLHRLKQEMGRIQCWLEQVPRRSEIWLPTDEYGVRILHMARELVKGGEARLTREKIVAEMAAADSDGMLVMREVECLPEALRIVGCEAIYTLTGEALENARLRIQAEKWVRNGKRPVSARKKVLFFEHALQLAAEMERPELYARLSTALERRGETAACVAEHAHHAAADQCLRLENLMALQRLLEEVDWESCFEEISETDMELREDPMGVYAAMDAPSRAQAREAVADLARALRLDERSVVRYALHEAREGMHAHGEHDPRATVCWYLLEDAGRVQLFRSLGCNRRPHRRIPDAQGTRSVWLMSVLSALFTVLFCAWMDCPILMIYALPLAWMFSLRLIAVLYPRWLKPMHILKLKMDKIYDHARTLVVLPVLLSSVDRVKEIATHMEALGCLEKDTNIDFLLLGDFRDGDAQAQPEDQEILSTARNEIARLNSNGRRKYFYLHRARSFREQDGCWMGENRKRGALMALNRLLLMRTGAQACFSAEGECALELVGRYRYVITLDADTEYLPGDLHRLIGAMEHPLNRACVVDGRRRGYAVLQPNMQLTAEACSNEYVRLMAGEGGVDSYPASVSDFYQDMTGYGNFAGKGIYALSAFTEATEGVLKDDEILSHDLIEGILAGAGYLNDVHFYDGCPSNLKTELSRLHRWTRGDWQLLPLLCSRLHMRTVDRMKLLGNLLRSLYAPTLLGLLIHAIWLDAPMAFSLGILLAFHEPLMQLPRMKGRTWKGALLKLAVLPAEAACSLDAILRTLWRMAISHRRLMEWVPAADSNHAASENRISGRIAALLLLPGIFRPFWIPAVLALAALFFVGADWAEDLARNPIDSNEELNDRQRGLLMDLAKHTWKFFEHYVPEAGCGLPPDNVQMDPPNGIARRTSPTNIGLYLMSCIAARELGFLTEENMLRRIEATTSTLESLEKWNGQLYNWYDLDMLAPLKPRYVSAVDSGNLAGGLLLCAWMLRNIDSALAKRLQALADGMDLASLYDARRKLFCIGIDVENNHMSEAHYDLYASEARILSYSAMMLGQVPVEHWKHLSRAEVRLGHEQALVSWSGTMFEYLMPELLMRSLKNTLAGQSRRGVLCCQKNWGKRMGRPWGVSESGYYAFDLQLNYQYRAFGMQELAMSGSAMADVVAPYATMLALAENPSAAVENLRWMCDMGWCGEYGMYEAADYLHLETNSSPKLVRSYMAHHQGMALCAMCNALKGNVLSKQFMQNPRAQGLRLLLQERPTHRISLRRRKTLLQPRIMRERRGSDFVRLARRAGYAADAHLLAGGGTTILANAHGGLFAWRDKIQMNRFFGNVRSDHEGLYVHLENPQTGAKAVLGDHGKLNFDLATVRYNQDFEPFRVRMLAVVSPESGNVYQRVEIENTEDTEREIILTGCFAVALAMENDMRAHPIFQNMFVESCYHGNGALVFRRRSRNGSEELPELAYLISGGESIEYETDYEKLVGRSGAVGRAGGIYGITGSEGCVLNPCAALRVRLRIAGKMCACVHFALGLISPEERDFQIARMMENDAPERALQLADTQMRAVLGYAGVDAKRFRLYQRMSPLLFDGKLRTAALGRQEACAPVPRERLWSMGISGDRPILLVEFDENDLECVREGIRLHLFWSLMGIQVDLVLVDCHGGDYYREARNAVDDLLASGHLNGKSNAPGGVYLLEKQNLSDAAFRALGRAAVVCLYGSEDAGAQLRTIVEGLQIGNGFLNPAMKPAIMQLPVNLEYFNGYGGFDEKDYCILVKRDLLPPAPWSNVLSSEQAGAVVTERGGGFAWYMNSRSGRLTSFANDALYEGWGWMFYMMDKGEKTWIRLLPGDLPMTDFIVRHRAGESCWQGRTKAISFDVHMWAENDGLHFEIRIRNESEISKHIRIAGFVDWLMGTDGADAGMMRCWSRFGACFASGAMEGVGCFVCDDPQTRTGCDRQTFLSDGDIMSPGGLWDLDRNRSGWTLHLPMNLKAGELRCCRFLLGCGKDAASTYVLARDFRNGGALRRKDDNWEERLERMRIHTPDTGVNLLSNGFLQAQALNGRIRARTGLYQPGGAYGFRDQLQDMLLMLYYEPQRVRRHLLYCAARQFEAGDVLHWWHEPYSGVRTKIRDDLLFLPFVTARYVQMTGDESVLWDSAPFLEDVDIPAGREDVYMPMRPATHCATLHEHCMRAFRYAAQTGEHGLCLMGGGDWNDGMNRVGAAGRGESVWLSEFLAVCAAEYACIAPNAEDRTWLEALNGCLRNAIENSAWDGAWYLRAFTDEGEKLGGSESIGCRIDAISQAWAVLAGLDTERCRSAIRAAWDQLADPKRKLIRLLTPPFDAKQYDPGYIAAYPKEIRENGAQYTHAACWMLYALAEMGDAERAHAALKMLLPMNHARDCEEAQIYRVEPYVMAADIYTNPQHAGRGGWTWYTGSAAWMFLGILKLLGYERTGDQVRLNALLGKWQEVSVEVKHGRSSYRLICQRDARQVFLDGERMEDDFIRLTDDGRAHTAVFPPRIGIQEEIQ